MTALLQAQPVSNLNPQLMGLINGFATGIEGWLPYEPDSIWLLEPPAGRNELYVDPVATLSVIWRYLGQPADAARIHAIHECETLYARLPKRDAVRFYDSMNPESPLCIPAPVLMGFVRQAQAIPARLSDFIDRAIDTIRSDARITAPDEPGGPWTLANLPSLPLPTAMIEFVPAAGWEYEGDVDQNTRRFDAWREEMRPVAARLEHARGEAVYYFSDPDSDTDDDSVHRFLLLHWLCSFRPASAYVRFLLDASGASNVEELKHALLDPASYAHPFKMHHAFFGMDSSICRIDLPPRDALAAI